MTYSTRLRMGLALGLALVVPLRSEEPAVPQVGDVQRLSVISLTLQVGSMEKETRRVTYTPPPGWYVRSHKVYCKKKTGLSSYTVNTLPRRWGWSSAEKKNESSRTVVEATGQSGHVNGKARLSVEQEEAKNDLTRVRSSHHALVLEATAKGEGFLRAGGVLELTIVAELVYVGPTS